MTIGVEFPPDFLALRPSGPVKQPPVNLTYAPTKPTEGYIKSYTGVIVSISSEAMSRRS